MDYRNFARADVKWPVLISTDDSSRDGVTINVSPSGAYIRCGNPLRLNEVFDMTIDVPNSEWFIEATAEVVFSNVYGPDDKISPRGMGVRFLSIASKDRKIIAKEVLQHLQADKVEIEQWKLQSLQTLIIDENETN
ncbi:MAG: PilZ domain-containing protein [Syntrophobacterales bacterium]|jgi:hypothetical protein